jgi:hypothetical protein
MPAPIKPSGFNSRVQTSGNRVEHGPRRFSAEPPIVLGVSSIDNTLRSSKNPAVFRAGLPVVGSLPGVLAVIALFVSLNIGLTVQRFELVLATEAGTVAAVGMLIVLTLRGMGSVSRLPILQTVVGPILKAVMGRHIAIGFRSGTILGILPAGIRVGITTILVALIVSRLIGTAVVRIIGLQAILVWLIIRTVGLPMVEALLVHEVVGIILAIGLVVLMVWLRLIGSGELRSDERGDRECQSKYP